MCDKCYLFKVDNKAYTFQLKAFYFIFLFIDFRERERQRNIDLLFHLFMHLLIDFFESMFKAGDRETR